MRRAIAIALAVTLIGAPAQATWRHDRCRYQGTQQATWTDREVRRTIRCATDHWGVLGGVKTALRVAKRESGFEHDANNPSSTALGVYQVLAGTWHGWRHHLRRFARRLDIGRSRKNARNNVLLSISVAHRSGWGAWGR